MSWKVGHEVGSLSVAVCFSLEFLVMQGIHVIFLFLSVTPDYLSVDRSFVSLKKSFEKFVQRGRHLDILCLLFNPTRMHFVKMDFFCTARGRSVSLDSWEF